MAKQIISDAEILSGTPVFAGTRIPPDQVAGLIRRGATDAELLQHFPILDAEDLAFGCAHAQQHPATANVLKPLKLSLSLQ